MALGDTQKQAIYIVLRETIENAIESLDLLLRRDSDRENDYQRWFESHPIIFQALGFIEFIPHPKIRCPERGTFVPDFVAKRPNQTWEIIELKTPSARILRNQSRREVFYASFEEYLSQCHEYSEAFDSLEARTQFLDEYKIDLKNTRPHSLIVAGIGDDLDVSRLFRLCSRRHPPISVYTYNDVLSALISYRTANFTPYDSAFGITVHSVLHIHKTGNSRELNHLLDIGIHRNRDRVAIFIDPQGFIRLRVWDSDGNQHNARSSRSFCEADYDVKQWFLFEVGISENFGFISMQIDGRYIADIRIENFPLKISHEYVIGSDWRGKRGSWFSVVELAVLNRALTFQEKMILRNHTIFAGADFPAELMDFEWSAIYSSGFGRRIEFIGHKCLRTAGHPLATAENGA